MGASSDAARAIVNAVAAAVDRGRPLTSRDLIKFDSAAVRALFDAGELVKADLRRGRAVETVILVRSPLPVDDASWTEDENDYLRLAYAAGVTFAEMERKLKRSGGDILQQAWRLKLERGRREAFGAEIPAWRIARLRGLVEEAYARGLNQDDGGGDLEHRALRRAFAAGRRAAAGRERYYDKWSAVELKRLRELRADGSTVAAIAAALRRTRVAVASKISELGLSDQKRWTEDEDRLVVASVERGLTIAAIAAIMPGRSRLAIKIRSRILCGKRGASPWSDEETRQLREAVARGDNLVELGRRLGRSKFAVRWRCRYLGLQGTHPKAVRPWQPHEDERIRAGWARKEKPSLIAEDLGRRLGRSKFAVRWRCRYLGLQGTHPKAVRPWQPHEDERIRAGWARKEKPSLIAEDLGRPLGGVYNRAFKLGIAGTSFRKRVTAADIAFIREKAAAHWTVEEIADALERTVDAIYRQAWLHRISFGRSEQRQARRVARKVRRSQAEQAAA